MSERWNGSEVKVSAKRLANSWDDFGAEELDAGEPVGLGPTDVHLQDLAVVAEEPV